MTFLNAYCRSIVKSWSPVFAQKRTTDRALRHAVALPCAMGRRTITRAICAMGRQQQDWSAEYKLFARSNWDENKLFAPVAEAFMKRYRKGFIPVGFDDTKIPKTGKSISSAFYQRDPMSPPFHTNLIKGLRFLQASMLFPLHREGDHDARGIPMRFTEAPVAKKPGKRASPEEHAIYKEAKKRFNLSTQCVDMMRGIRNELDQNGAYKRKMLAVLDGSFTNRTVFRAEVERIDMIGRCRKDAKLCLPAEPGGRRKYSTDKFTPEQVRQDDSIPWSKASVYYGGAKRAIRHKELGNILWQRGSGLRRLRLFAIAPQPYKVSAKGKTNYRQPAYLLCTDLDSSAKDLLQAYFDRWQIEVNHREEKSTLGVGQAQVHSSCSVPRHPAFLVASYSIMLLCSLELHGPNRTSDFMDLPKWRRNAKRPSALDLITLLRKDISEAHFSDVPGKDFSENLRNYAYT